MTDLAKALAFFDKASAQLSHADPVPKDFFTTRQFCKVKGLTFAAMKLRLDRLVDKGFAERRQFKLADGKTAAHYKMLAQ